MIKTSASEVPVAAPIKRGPLIVNLIAQITFGLLAMTICLPSMQEWGADFGSSQSAVQLTFSGYVLAYGLLQPVCGQLSDRHGRRVVLLVGLIVAAAASLLAALAPNLTTLIIARVLQGAGGAAGIVIARSMVQDFFVGPERTRIMAYIGMAMGLCPPVGTVLGGQLHARLGWQANFVLIAALALCLLLAAMRGLPRQVPVLPSSSGWIADLLKTYGRLARDPVFVLYMTVLAMTTAAFYAFLAGAPLVLGSLGVGPASVGFFIMLIPLSYIVGNFATSRLVQQLGERRIMVWGQGLTLVGLALMLGLAVLQVSSPLAFAVPLMLFGFGHGFLMPSALAGSVNVVAGLAGSAAGVAGLGQQMMGAVAGYSVGWVNHEGPINLGLLMLMFTLLALAAQYLLHHKRRDPVR